MFVINEAEVGPVAAGLGEALANANVKVVPCPNGKVIGQENDVRVFDIQHIKGLEFEAAFFVDVDRLEGLYPGLVDKYLYVGTTRAASYFGITTAGLLPPYLAPLRQMFQRDWVR